MPGTPFCTVRECCRKVVLHYSRTVNCAARCISSNRSSFPEHRLDQDCRKLKSDLQRFIQKRWKNMSGWTEGSIFVQGEKDMSSSANEQTTEQKCLAREISIPVPWGHIAGKEWGNPNGKPLLGIHGWLDNAGTFDLLAPALSENFRFVAIDIPGHGFSSHIPEGFLYHFNESLIFVKKVIRHLCWDRFSIIGHSMGGGMGMLFAAVFPEHVEKLISLDMVKPVSRPIESTVWRTRQSVEQILEVEEKMKTPRVYTYDAAVERLVETQNQSLTRASAEVLLKRGAKSSLNGTEYMFTRDLRHSARGLYAMTSEQDFEFLSKIQCEVMIIKASETSAWEEVSLTARALEIFRKCSKKFEYVVVDGRHHVHLNEPEKVLPHILRFLSNANKIKL